MLKAPYCWQRHRVQWSRGYCRAVLRWSSDCIEPRYKSSALPLPFTSLKTTEVSYDLIWLQYHITESNSPALVSCLSLCQCSFSLCSTGLSCSSAVLLLSSVAEEVWQGCPDYHRRPSVVLTSHRSADNQSGVSWHRSISEIHTLQRSTMPTQSPPLPHASPVVTVSVPAAVKISSLSGHHHRNCPIPTVSLWILSPSHTILDTLVIITISVKSISNLHYKYKHIMNTFIRTKADTIIHTQAKNMKHSINSHSHCTVQHQFR